MLPDGDGRDVCRALRRRLVDVPIMMLTARGTEIDRIVGLELGADDYVVKPFSGAEVIARIRAVLRRARPAADRRAAAPVASRRRCEVDLGRPPRRTSTARSSSSRARSSTCSPSWSATPAGSSRART